MLARLQRLRPIARAEPTGEILEPTAEDLGALARIHGRARTRLGSMWVCAGLMLWYAVPIGGGPAAPSLPWIPAVLGVGGVALGLYALWSRANPRGLCPSSIGLDPAGEVTAGRLMRISVALQPRKDLRLDPLQVGLVARRAEQGRDGKEIVYEAREVVARGRTVEQGRAARLEAEVRIPEDAPTARRIRWHVEVTAGEPPILVTTRRIRVLPARRRGAKPQSA